MRTATVSTDDAEGSGGDGPALVVGSRYHRWAVPAAIVGTYGLFAVAVHLRLLDNLDVAAQQVARPHDVWGPVQTRAARLTGVLQPAHLALSVLLFVAALSLLRRSFRPLWVMAALGLPAALVTTGTKWAMAYWDPRTAPVSHESFPSGHMVSAVIAVGVVVLLVRPRTHWGWLLPVGAGCVMGSALVLASVHPATDVIGGDLLAAAVLTGATAATLGQWASDRHGGLSDEEPHDASRGLSR